MSRGKRYNDEQKLNLKKVFAVIVTIVVIVMFVIGIKKLLKKENPITEYFTENAYFTIYENGKWGVVNSKGETIINAEYNDMIVIPDPKRDVFICTYEVNYSDGTYKTKAVNANNAQLYTTFNSVETLSNYDKNNNVWNEENVLKVEKDGKFGLINLDGTELLACTYDKIDTLKGVKNSIIVEKDGKIGLVNNRGERIIENEYSEVLALTEDYTNGYIVKNTENKYGIISTNKENVLECKYEQIKNVCGNNMYVVKNDGKWFIVNAAGDKNIEVTYEDITYIGTDSFVAKVNGKYGIYGIDKSEKVKPEYDSIVYAFSTNYIAKKDNQYGIINESSENSIQFEYAALEFNKDADCLYGKKANDDKTYLIDRNLEVKVIANSVVVYNGFIRANVNGEYKFYNLKFEEKSNRDAFTNNTLYVAKNDGKYGLVNKDGTLVVQYQYEDITEQNAYGYVGVKKDGKWGIIDQHGNVVVEPKYEFSDISKVTFIGKWHSVEEVNTTYLVCE
ncbi:MAG: WG repeat-containing protein [Clostridia bacterium]|nr:WG repeat-containing protein [Clostridia bacterium]